MGTTVSFMNHKRRISPNLDIPQNRDMKDCFVACVDGLKCLPEAIEAMFPEPQVVQPPLRRPTRALDEFSRPWDEKSCHFS